MECSQVALAHAEIDGACGAKGQLHAGCHFESVRGGQDANVRQGAEGLLEQSLMMAEAMQKDYKEWREA